MTDRLDHLEHAIASVIDAVRRVVDDDGGDEVRRKLDEAEKSLLLSIDEGAKGGFTMPPIDAGQARAFVELLQSSQVFRRPFRRLP